MNLTMCLIMLILCCIGGLMFSLYFMCKAADLEDKNEKLQGSNEDLWDLLGLCENAMKDYRITMDEKFEFVPTAVNKEMKQNYCKCFANTAEYLINVINVERRNV